MIREQLIRDEGRRLDPYLDCCGRYWRECVCEKKGHLTIGVGTNLDAGITHAEVLCLLDNRIAEKTQELSAKLPWTAHLDPVRFGAMLNLAFNMGVDGLIMHNPKFLALMRVARYLDGANELLRGDETGDYKLSVGHQDGEAQPCRAHRVARQISSGVWV